MNFITVIQKKIKSVRKSAKDVDKGQDAGGDDFDSSAELVIADEAFKLLQLVLRRAAATFRQIRCLSLWGNTGSAVIGRVRDSLAKVLLPLLVLSLFALKVSS